VSLLPSVFNMIRHAAIFRLKHAKGSAEEKSFPMALRKLREVVSVEQIEVVQ
jgi:hypothetical protein